MQHRLSKCVWGFLSVSLLSTSHKERTRRSHLQIAHNDSVTNSPALPTHRAFIQTKSVSLIFRLPWVTVRHEYIGSRSYRVSPFTSVQDVKQLLYEETDLPVKEQRLTHNGKVVSYSCYSNLILTHTKMCSLYFFPAMNRKANWSQQNRSKLSNRIVIS